MTGHPSTTRFFSSTETTTTTNNNDDDGTYLTGTVKFYLRNRLFGFIIPDDPLVAGPEVWVHRTSIQTPYSFEEFPNRPYLQKNERVKFQIEYDDGNSDDNKNNNDDVIGSSSGDSTGEHSERENKPKAVNVMFENGRQIPLFRKNYHAAVIRGESQRLGKDILDLFESNEMTVDDTELLDKIKELVENAKEKIQAAERNVADYGIGLGAEEEEPH